MIPDWAAKATAVPYADFGNPQSLNLYSYVRNNPLSQADLDGHCPVITNDDSCLKAGDAMNLGLNPFSGEDSSLPGTTLAAQKQNTDQSQQKAAPANSRTDVVLHGRETTPTPNWSYVGLWTMDWYVSACSTQGCSNQTAANEEQTISLVESQNGGPWVPQGGAKMGKNTDTISPEGPKYFDQRWFVDGKQVQLVVGRDGGGNLIKAWQVHVTVNKTGDIPKYSPGS